VWVFLFFLAGINFRSFKKIGFLAL